MKNTGIVKVLGIIGILILSLANIYTPVPIMADGSGTNEVSKVSSSLSLHIKIKSAALAHPNTNLSGLTVLPGLNPNNSDSTFLNHEEVFLYFNQPPTASQLNDLQLAGVTVYPDSWIPPVGNHPTGFILADMPVDQLDALSAKDYIVRMDTAEQEAQPQNDLARQAMGVDSVWSGGDKGAGVTVAVLDSGIDTSNPDFPALNASNSKDYSNYPILDDTIANHVTGHGTHVAGSLLGRGVNSPAYAGVAPDANLVFLKIGNDTTSTASSSAIIFALKAAVDTYHAKIINLSYGGWSEYHDGSDVVCQAVDYATSRGAAVFVAAGNNAGRSWHYSGTVDGFSTTGDIPVVTANGTNALPMNLVWSDGLGAHKNLSLQYYDSSHSLLTSIHGSQSESPTGTEAIQSQLNDAGAAGIYYLRVQNNSPSSQLFHIYSEEGDTSVTFSNPDPGYTLDSPAEADSAISVGAYVTRTSWTDYQGSPQHSSTGAVGSIAVFSSRGPRVDGSGLGKPDIVAPGQAIISVRDNSVYPWPAYNTNADVFPYAKDIIDNDGLNLNGSGPADYFVMQGTSMACPLAAGVGALLLSDDPALTPEQVRHALESTAIDQGDTGYDNIYGWGLINAPAAIAANATLKSYSDAAHSSACNNFSNSSTQSIAYMYGTGYLVNHIYQVAYYDGSNNKIARDYVTSDIAGALSSQHAFVHGADSPGTWHVIVSEPEFNLPSPFDFTTPYAIAVWTFTVQGSAIVTRSPAVISTVELGVGGNSPTAVGVNAATNFIYVASIQGNDVSVIDGESDTVIAAVGVGFWPEGIAVNPDTNRIYVANILTHDVSVIDGISNTVVATVDVGSLPFRLGVNVSTNRIYVANSGGDTVSVIDGLTNTVIATVNVGSGPAGIGVNPVTNRIYVSNDGSNNVSVIDGASNLIVATIDVGSGPGGVDVNPLTGRVYVANFGDNSVSVIDGAHNSVVATLGVGAAPRGIAVNPTTNHIYVANYGSNDVSVIDGADNSLMATVNVENNPFGIGANSTTNRIYVANNGSDSVSVIQDISSKSPPAQMPASSSLSTGIMIVAFAGIIMVFISRRRRFQPAANPGCLHDD